MNAATDIVTSKGKIVLIKGYSQYNVLRLACDSMAKGFEENGYQTVVLDGTRFASEEEVFETIKKEMEEGGLFIFSYNALYHNSMFNSQMSLYDYLGYPVFGFLVDHPIYHTNRIELSQGDNIFIGCVDKDHVSYIQKYYPKLQHVSFLPHFCFQGDNIIPYKDREIDIYYPGSYKDPEMYKHDFEGLPKVFYGIAMEIVKALLRDSGLTMEEALNRYLASIRFEYSTEDFLNILKQIYQVDHYVRDLRRDKIVKAILDSGISLTVSGSGWEQIKDDYKDKLHIVCEGGLDIEKNIKLISNTKILFNTLPNFKNGTHERIFTAMKNGCVCLTDASGYLLKNFENDKEICFYDINKINEIPEKINELLNHPEKAKWISDNAYKRIGDIYDNKQAAKRVLEIIGLE